MKLPAKKLFGGQKMPTANMKPRAIGSYAKGCHGGRQGTPDRWSGLAGDAPVAQPQLGPPALVALVERLASEAKAKDGWNGLLVGDLPSRAAARCCPATPATRSASTPTSG